MEKTERFGLVLSQSEKKALQQLARCERISRAAVICRLVWREAERHGLLSQDQGAAPSDGRMAAGRE